jgi:ribonuclease R
VPEDSPLDREAFERGNSCYFPDRVIPMLPERLSNGLCSLNPREDRHCLAVHLWIDAKGVMQRYRFAGGTMCSSARMTYTQVQRIHDEGGDAIVTPLYEAYAALALERDGRGALDLNLPEFKVALDESGHVRTLAPRERLESHRLIEAYMIAANVAAADFLLKQKQPAIYRVHEAPDQLKLEELRAMLEHLGYKLSKGDGIRARHFNKVLEKARGAPEETIVNQSILRAQMQAYYSPKNLGHFGLALQRYCHFTSPIRRYADLVVHRAIIAALEQAPQQKKHGYDDAANHISQTERKAMQAERDAMDRYRAAFMARKVGHSFHAVITGLNEAGLFATLQENGITGFIPMRTLGGDYYQLDKRRHTLRGERTRKAFGLGDHVSVTVEDANALTGNLIFSIAGLSSSGLTRGPIKPKKKYKRH